MKIQNPKFKIRNGFHHSSFFIRISCLLAFAAVAADTKELQLVPAYGELPPTFWEQHGTLVIIGVLVFLAVAAAVIWEIFRAKPAPVLPPDKIALEALARLRSQPEDGKLLSEVSQILRRYIGAALDFPGGEMTTAEFCAAISHNEKIGAERSQPIASFLHECDVRKFSPANAANSLDAVRFAEIYVIKVRHLSNQMKRGKPKS